MKHPFVYTIWTACTEQVSLHLCSAAVLGSECLLSVFLDAYTRSSMYVVVFVSHGGFICSVYRPHSVHHI